MTPTVSGISQLDRPPRPHNARTEALNALELSYANLQGYNDPTQSTSVRTGVNKIVTRFGLLRFSGLLTCFTEGLVGETGKGFRFFGMFSHGLGWQECRQGGH